MAQAPEEIILHPAPPSASPGISLGDLFTYLPLLEKLIAAVTAALASGSFTIPLFIIRIAGKRLKIGPVPISLVP